MYALILRYKTSVGVTPPGILILHQTHESVLVGSTPLSKVLLKDYEKGIRFFVYDRTTHTRKEKIIAAKNFEVFIKQAAAFYTYAKMTIEQVSYTENEDRTIMIDDVLYKLGEIIR